VNATATFTGQVTDQSGAAIVGATVKITSQDTGSVITRETSGDGNYTVPLLNAGNYTIEVTASGFAPNTRKNITLQIQQVGQEDFKLTVGGVDQQVNVQQYNFTVERQFAKSMVARAAYVGAKGDHLNINLDETSRLRARARCRRGVPIPDSGRSRRGKLAACRPITRCNCRWRNA